MVCLELVESPSNTIPRQIFMFWESGWEGQTGHAALAAKSFQLMNPTWEVILLNRTTADAITHREDYFPDGLYYRKWRVQARSDVLRTLLLYQRGGVWADATLLCNRPLDSWLKLDAPDLVTFERHENKAKQERMNISPWITSWFLASPPQGKTISSIHKVVTDPNQLYRMRKEYFWWHRICSEVFKEEGNKSRAMSFPSADAMHCVTPDWTHSAPVLKRCANEEIASVVAITDVCCSTGGDDLLRQRLQFACESWNCEFLSKNLDNIGMVEEQFGGSLPDLRSFQFKDGKVQITWLNDENAIA